jgi:hypothetical protein
MADRTETLLAALLQPTIDMMQGAGISRMAIARDKSVVLQMEDGETLTIEPSADAARPAVTSGNWVPVDGAEPFCRECLRHGPDYCPIHAE